MLRVWRACDTGSAKLVAALRRALLAENSVASPIDKGFRNARSRLVLELGVLIRIPNA